MKMVTENSTIAELKQMANNLFGDMVWSVVDINRETLIDDAERHADIEWFLLPTGSSQEDLGGINVYPDAPRETFVEVDSLSDIRPSCDNISR